MDIFFPFCFRNFFTKQVGIKSKIASNKGIETFILLIERKRYMANALTQLKSFTTIVEQYPNHPKVMDSNFKLGKIYFQLGQNKLARRFLDKAAASSGGVASKAQSYLDKNF